MCWDHYSDFMSYHARTFEWLRHPSPASSYPWDNFASCKQCNRLATCQGYTLPFSQWQLGYTPAGWVDGWVDGWFLSYFCYSLLMLREQYLRSVSPDNHIQQIQNLFTLAWLFLINRIYSFIHKLKESSTISTKLKLLCGLLNVFWLHYFLHVR